VCIRRFLVKQSLKHLQKLWKCQVDSLEIVHSWRKVFDSGGSVALIPHKICDEKKLSSCCRFSVEEKLSRSWTDVPMFKTHHKLATVWPVGFTNIDKYETILVHYESINLKCLKFTLFFNFIWWKHKIQKDKENVFPTYLPQFFFNFFFFLWDMKWDFFFLPNGLLWNQIYYSGVWFCAWKNHVSYIEEFNKKITVHKNVSIWHCFTLFYIILGSFSAKWVWAYYDNQLWSWQSGWI
jgi:hypothetical protein